MKSIFFKELQSFFSSIIGYVVISVFLIVMGLFTWVFSDSSILENNYANLDSLFSIAPAVMIFLIPAMTMKSFAEEFQFGTIEILLSKPIRKYEILLGKYFAHIFIVFLTILPTGIYVYSVHELGAPQGNLDAGGIAGSYLGLLMLGCSFVAIGLFSSLLSSNQIVAFLIGSFLCFFMHWAFGFASRLPAFYGRIDDVIEELGLNYHYAAMSKGLIDSADVLYFLSVIVFFLVLAHALLDKKLT